jgi:radical SAM superfamily enzyme YgiQ (UPF0313 family)
VSKGEANRGLRVRERVAPAQFPSADTIVEQRIEQRPRGAVDILFVNPPAPDRAIWIRSQHRVGRRSREGMIWAQGDLAQMAALFPDYHVEVIDAIATRMGWPAFEKLLREKQPLYYITQVTGPTLQNDMRGCFLARSLGAATIAFGTHVTPMPVETMERYPALDYVLRGEPELTVRELVDTITDSKIRLSNFDPWGVLKIRFRQRLGKLFTDADPEWQPAWLQHPASNSRPPTPNLQHIKGLVWRRDGHVTINPDRPFIRHLDDLPLPRHDLLPLHHYRAPLVGGPYAFVLTSRGCPAGCRFCIKHVSYGRSLRLRSPENILAELKQLANLGIRRVHMYADLFTASREQVMGLCHLIEEEGLRIRWTCNSRVDFVDEEMLEAMARTGCWLIAWGIESGSQEILRRVHKGFELAQAEHALRWARSSGIKNWGYFIIGLPGETEESIQETIALSKKLPLDLALFHIAAPHPGTPFFFEVVEQGWFRAGTRWEQVDMDRSTVLEYPGLPAERLEHWARTAFRQWAFRPGPIWTGIKMLLSSPRLWPMAARVGLESLGWGLGT